MPTPDPARALAELGIGGRVRRLLSDQRNVHWEVRTPEGPAVLRWCRAGSLEDARYENELISFLGARGWPVAEPIADPVEIDGSVWCAFVYLDGEQPDRSSECLRETGRIIARLQKDLIAYPGRQRPGWRRRDELWQLEPSVEVVLSERGGHLIPDDAAVLMEYALRARSAMDAADAAPRTTIHADVVPWNLLYRDGELTGLLDFELAHYDLRVADFAWSWRGKYTAVIEGFEEIERLDPRERALIPACYLSWLLQFVHEALIAGNVPDLAWIMPHILRVGGEQAR